MVVVDDDDERMPRSVPCLSKPPFRCFSTSASTTHTNIASAYGSVQDNPLEPSMKEMKSHVQFDAHPSPVGALIASIIIFYTHGYGLWLSMQHAPSLQGNLEIDRGSKPQDFSLHVMTRLTPQCHYDGHPEHQPQRPLLRLSATTIIIIIIIISSPVGDCY